MIIKPETIIINSDDEKKFQNFIVFEPASLRVKEPDILFRGPQIRDLFYHVDSLIENDESICNLILKNRLNKIGKMLDLVLDFDNIVMTKFFDRIWRRYSYLSNLGEMFLDLNIFLLASPEYKAKYDDIIATRLEEDDDILSMETEESFQLI